MPNSYPYDLIGPVTIVWRPTTSPGSSDQAHSLRTLWLICHPTIFESAFRSLVVSSSFAVEGPDIKRKHKVEVLDLRGKFNIFELMGPKSSQVIKGTLTPAPDEKSEEFSQVSFVPSFLVHKLNALTIFKFWDGLQQLQCPGGLPSGMVVGLKVHDPRLRSVPPFKSVKLALFLKLPPASRQPTPPFECKTSCYHSNLLTRRLVWPAQKYGTQLLHHQQNPASGKEISTNDVLRSVSRHF